MPANIVTNTDPGETTLSTWWKEPTYNPGSTAIVKWKNPKARDNSGPPKLQQSHKPGDSFPIGITVVTYIATDSSSNTATAVFTITVKGKSIQFLIWFN